MTIFKQAGQIGLLIVVVMGVLVSLSLSVASRTLGELVLSRQEKEGSQAFHVAEQGVEEALNAIRQNKNLGSGSTYVGTVGAGGLVTGEYSVGGYGGLDLYVKEGEVAEIDLDGASGSVVTFLWTKLGDPKEDLACVEDASSGSPAALEIIQIVSQSDPVVRSYYNASNCDLSASNGFTLSSAPGSGYRSSVAIDTSVVGATRIRVRPIYSGATIALSGVDLSAQIYLIQASAEGGDAQKEIEVRRTYDTAPSIFDFAVFSGGTIVK